jgi:pyruvate dehydrogenase E2 component (dihydrolipoamide acetyltransferase)
VYELKMPQWGMNMTEGDIVRWLKNEGDYVQKDEPIVEIESAKAVSEHNSPVAGRLAKILARDGDTVAVYEVIAMIESAADE